MTQSKVGLL